MLWICLICSAKTCEGSSINFDMTMTKSVLIIYTGGTIGMVNDPATGALCPFDFEQIAKAVPEIREFGFSIKVILYRRSSIRPIWTGTLGRPVPNHSGQIDQYSGFVILHGTDTMLIRPQPWASCWTTWPNRLFSQVHSFRSAPYVPMAGKIWLQP